MMPERRGATVWFLLGATVAIAFVAVLTARRLSKRPNATHELSEVILTAMAADWSKRFALDEAALRRAVAENGDPDIRARIAADLGVVDVKFARRPGPGRSIATSVLCEYPEEGERSTAEFELPWEDTPSDVRGEFLRSGRNEAFRKWTMQDGGMTATTQ